MINICSFRSTNFLENTYLVFDDNKNAAVIDPGGYSDSERRALDAHIRFLDLTLRMVLLTHVHIDHVLGCSYLMNKYNAPAFVHSKDLSALRKMKGYASTIGYELEELPENFIQLSEGDRFALGNKISFEVLHTPGHTPGSVCFYYPPLNIMFSGDLIYRNDIGRVDLPGGNSEELKKSIIRIFSLDLAIRLLPGHGPHTTIGNEKQWNVRTTELLAT